MGPLPPTPKMPLQLKAGRDGDGRTRVPKRPSKKGEKEEVKGIFFREDRHVLHILRPSARPFVSVSDLTSSSLLSLSSFLHDPICTRRREEQGSTTPFFLLREICVHPSARTSARTVFPGRRRGPQPMRGIRAWSTLSLQGFFSLGRLRLVCYVATFRKLPTKFWGKSLRGKKHYRKY